ASISGRGRVSRPGQQIWLSPSRRPGVPDLPQVFPPAVQKGRHKRGGPMAVGQVFLSEFFWNLSTPVGHGQANRTDDVELVRFGYHMMRIASDIHLATPKLRDALRQMRRTGDFDTDLDTVIRAHQAQKKIPIDGKVSVAHLTVANRGRYDGHHTWII